MDGLDFPANQYDVVLADPPWSYSGQQDNRLNGKESD